MEHAIPGIDEIRALLAPLSMKQLAALADLSGVPVRTIYKVRRGETDNPGIETVRKFLPHVAAAAAPSATEASNAA